jgi:hypothetical protein
LLLVAAVVVLHPIPLVAIIMEVGAGLVVTKLVQLEFQPALLIP